jgi:hypothetical protein
MRRELALRGINVNGSKEVLISRLEGSSWVVIESDSYIG